jgi:hypothetical protein
MGIMLRVRALALTLSLPLFRVPPVVFGQGDAVDLRYSTAQLDCARFLESAESNIRTETGGRIRLQTSGRTGVWEFRAASARNNAIAIEGWLDSLSVWRRSAETVTRPDTDGLLGGRYRGTLSLTGSYHSTVRPFVPDEVAEIAGMATALDDFLPPLPRSQLRPGQSWTDSAGITLRRLPDSALSGVPLYRIALESRRHNDRADIGDSVPLRLKQVSVEHGSYVWHPSLGMIRRDRRIVVETSVPPGGSVRQSVRSRIEQRITTTRDLTASAGPNQCSEKKQ